MKANINNKKINIYENVLQEVCERFSDAEAFVRERIEEPCSKKNYQLRRQIYWVCNDYKYINN